MTAEMNDRIRNLVKILDNLPDMKVLSMGCGHRNPTGYPRPGEEFGVELIIKPTKAGYFSLGIVTRAAQIIGSENISVTTIVKGEDPRFLQFYLKGIRGADPDKLGEAILALTERQDRANFQEKGRCTGGSPKNRFFLFDKTSITKDQLDRAIEGVYQVTTIVPSDAGPYQRVYILKSVELYDVQDVTEQSSEFIVDIRRIT